VGGARRVTRRVEKGGAHRVLVRKHWERDSLEEISVNGRIILK
jgi:hypothetical protein